MRSRKILFITGSFPNSKEGIADSAKLLLDAMGTVSEESDVEFVLVTTDNAIITENIESNTSSKVYLMKNWRVLPSNISYIFNILKEEHITDIHMEYPGDLYGKTFLASFLPLFIKLFNVSKREKIDFHVRLHEFSRARLLRRIAIIPIVLWADDVYIPSLHDRNVISKIARNKVKKTLIGANINVKKTWKDYHSIQSENKKIVISYFGSVYHGKGIEQMLSLWKEIKAKDIEDRVCFRIIGDVGTEDDNHFCEYHKKVWKWIDESGIKDYITVTGFVDEDKASEEIAKSDIATLLYEDGLTLRRGSFLAYLAHGVPVITTSMDDEAMEMLGDLGGVYAQDNPGQMVDKVFEWIDLEDSEKNRISEDNSSKAKLFSWDSIAKNFLYDYQILK